MGAFGLLVSVNYSLIAVTSLTRLNCKSSQYRHSESLRVIIIDFSKRSVTSAPFRAARIGVRILDFASLCFHRPEPRHRKDLRPEYTVEYKSRRKSFFIARLPPCRSTGAPFEAAAPIARQSRSIKRARTTGHRFIRAKSLAPKCQESVARVSVPLVCSTSRVPFLPSRHPWRRESTC